MNRLRVGVIYGGRSGEHEISIVSAASVCRHLNPSKYEAVPIFITRDGRWAQGGAVPTARSAAEALQAAAGAPPGTMEPTAAIFRNVDVVFPVLHGPFGEDGTVQGLLELAGVPYVGAGVLGSAAGMDKAVMKALFSAAGLPVAPYRVLLRHDWQLDRQRAAAAAAALGYPVFVKPANLGSSVGISKAPTAGDLDDALALAFDYDRKAVIEAAVPHAREIECGVLGNDDPEASVPGEIIPSREFYDYEAKYLDDQVRLLIPAPISEAEASTVRRLSLAAFAAVDAAGMARVDFLMNGSTGALYVSEVNTIPGFTAVSMYPMLWEASGVPYAELIDRLIGLALERHAEKQRLRTSR